MAEPGERSIARLFLHLRWCSPSGSPVLSPSERLPHVQPALPYSVKVLRSARSYCRSAAHAVTSRLGVGPYWVVFECLLPLQERRNPRGWLQRSCHDARAVGGPKHCAPRDLRQKSRNTMRLRSGTARVSSPPARVPASRVWRHRNNKDEELRMSRRRKSSPLDDMIDLVSMLPGGWLSRWPRSGEGRSVL